MLSRDTPRDHVNRLRPPLLTRCMLLMVTISAPDTERWFPEFVTQISIGFLSDGTVGFQKVSENRFGLWEPGTPGSQ